jgi:putative ABC transport system permease protein
MKYLPPKWADRFLQWYCRPELLEEIQGDAYELFYRTAVKHPRKAKIQFAWNVLRFFRWKNMKRTKNKSYHSIIGMDMLKNILTVAARNFVRQPGHSFLSIFGLSSGLICALLILTWIIHETSFDRFHSEPDTIYKVMTHVKSDGNFQTYDLASSVIDVSSIPEVTALASVSSGSRWPHELCFRPEGKTNECIYLNGVYANENLFSLFNFPILKGDPHPLKGATNIAISEKMAERLYGNTSPIGKIIKVDDRHELTIASVFKNIPINSSLQFDFALPYAILQKQWGVDEAMMTNNFFNIYIRVGSPISTEALTAKLNDIRVLTEEHKSQNVSYQAYPLLDWHLKSKFEGGKNTGGKIEYIILFGIIGALVVVMAVINLVNMSTARASMRAKEIGIRKVTGALRSSIAAQFMIESFSLVLFAFIVSVIAVEWILPYFSSLLMQPIEFHLLHGYTLLYLIGFLFIVAILAGLYPALIMSSFQPVRILKGQLTTNASGNHGFRKSLLVIQLSVSLIIVIFSGVLYQQLEFITQKNLGFNRSNMIRLEPTFRLLKSYESFKNELLKNPNIISVGASNDNPLNSAGANTGVTWPGKPDDLRVSIRTIGCNPDFPRTMGLKILEGNDFQSEKSDTLRTEVLVTQEAVKVMGLKDPIGAELKFGQIPCVIIGVINDFHTSSLHEVLLPVILYRQHIQSVSALYIAFKPGTTEQSMMAINDTYKSFEPDNTMKYWFQDETFNETYKTEIVASRLTFLFTFISLSIAIIGVVGLATFTTIRKTKEIGIRRVFGASATQALLVLSHEFISVLIIAILVAVPLAWYTSHHWLQGFAYRTNLPWGIFIVSVVGLFVVIMLVIVALGIKTIRNNPTQSLRTE